MGKRNTVTKKIPEEESCLLKLLRGELTGEYERLRPCEWENLFHVAKKHRVLSFLYHSLTEGEQVPEWLKDEAVREARYTVQQSYRLLFLSRYLIRRLEEANIPVVLLKGAGTAGYYPVPELRKSGDVDLLLLAPKKTREAGKILEKAGCIMQEKQPTLHHIIYQTSEGIEVELHILLAEPFDNGEMNRYLHKKLSECEENIRRSVIMGIELPILDTAYHGYELLLHMLQHFLRAGFGLKLLCDWVVFWNHEAEETEKKKYLKLVKESGIKGFSDMVTLTCIRYLGLKAENVAWMELGKGYDIEGFLLDILEAEEFGRSAANRMVALRSQSPFDYIREFHHQMRLNFPISGKNVLCWPFLWVITLVRFLRNNRIVRRISTMSILGKAKQRSRMMRQIGLFKKKNT